jgi:hypothetical protein
MLPINGKNENALVIVIANHMKKIVFKLNKDAVECYFFEHLYEFN